jgi:hypothetical protein
MSVFCTLTVKNKDAEVCNVSTVGQIIGENFKYYAKTTLFSFISVSVVALNNCMFV